MPIIKIDMLEGRNQEEKKELIEKVTDTISQTLEVPNESIRIIINEVPFENYGVAGMPVQEYRVMRAKQNNQQNQQN